MKTLFLNIVGLALASTVTTLASAAEVRGARLNDSKTAIVLDVAYVGGCREHKFSLAVEPCRETFPVSCNVKLIEDAQGDACEGFASRTIELPLANYGLTNSYYAGANLLITGDRATSASVKLPTQAVPDQSAPLKFVCTENNGSVVQTIVLEQIEAGALVEDSIGKEFLLSSYDDSVSSSNLVWVKLGRATLDDVLLHFTSNNGQYIFYIYLDELDQAGLSINGQDAGDYTCHR